MSDRPPDQGICKCGLAWSYHDGRLKTWDEYKPRYAPPGDDPPARTPPADAAPDLRAAVHEPHHLGYPVSGKTGTYDATVVMVKRDWYERLLALIDAHDCIRQAAPLPCARCGTNDPHSLADCIVLYIAALKVHAHHCYDEAALAEARGAALLIVSAAMAWQAAHDELTEPSASSMTDPDLLEAYSEATERLLRFTRAERAVRP